MCVSLQYVRQCIAKEVLAQLSIKNFQELVPLDKDQFIRPIFSRKAAKPGTEQQRKVVTRTQIERCNGCSMWGVPS